MRSSGGDLSRVYIRFIEANAVRVARGECVTEFRVMWQMRVSGEDERDKYNENEPM